MGKKKLLLKIFFYARSKIFKFSIILKLKIFKRCWRKFLFFKICKCAKLLISIKNDFNFFLYMDLPRITSFFFQSFKKYLLSYASIQQTKNFLSLSNNQYICFLFKNKLSFRKNCCNLNGFNCDVTVIAYGSKKWIFFQILDISYYD